MNPVLCPVWRAFLQECSDAFFGVGQQDVFYHDGGRACVGFCRVEGGGFAEGGFAEAQGCREFGGESFGEALGLGIEAFRGGQAPIS